MSTAKIITHYKMQIQRYRKLKEKYDKCGLTINTVKRKYQVIRNQRWDIETKNGIIETWEEFKCLAVTIT